MSFDNHPQTEEVKFNAALENLKQISEVTKELIELSRNKHLDIYAQTLSVGKAQHIKYTLVKSYVILCGVLLDPLIAKAYLQRIEKVRLFFMPKTTGRPISTVDNALVPKGYYEAFNPAVEIELDRIVFDIRISIEEKGKFFVPKKGENRLF